MKIYFILQMIIKQKCRDKLNLTLAMFTAPLFVFFYWVLFSSSPIVYNVNVAIDDSTDIIVKSHIDNIEKKINHLSSKSDYIKIKLTHVTMENFKKNILTERAALCIEFPKNLLTSNKEPNTVKFYGDQNLDKTQTVINLIKPVISDYLYTQLNINHPVIFETISTNTNKQFSPFELYIPGLIVFAVIMIIFSSSMSVVKDVEAGTFSRILLSRINHFELLFAICIVQFLIGVTSVILTFLTALICGFQINGSLLPAIIATSIACCASIGIGMTIAGLSKNQSSSFLFSSIAMFLLVLFSGIIFPKPEMHIFTIHSKSIDMLDILPTTHLSNSLYKTLFAGATIQDIVYEISGLLFIALLTFLCGSLLFIKASKPASNTWEGML